MKTFLLKLSLFLSPFILAILIELFVLPIDFFTFRVWEALVATRKYHFILRGPFYPNMTITKIESGDLLPHTKFAIKRMSKWETDQYGYRKKKSNTTKYRIVVVGDSNIAGCGSTQEDMLSEVLENQLKVGVYPLAPAGLDSFLRNRRFMDHPPDIAIFGSVERDITSLTPVKLKKRRAENRYIRFIRSLREIPSLQSVAILLDRIEKANMLQYVRSRLPRSLSSSRKREISLKEGSMIFFQGVDANKDISEDQLKKTAQVIEQYNQVLKEIGIRFIFLPIPNKENIYYELLPVKKRPDFLERLIAELKERGVETVDTQRAFEEEYRKNGTLLYHLNDTHWNANGMRITAALIKEMIEKHR